MKRIIIYFFVSVFFLACNNEMEIKTIKYDGITGSYIGHRRNFLFLNNHIGLITAQQDKNSIINKTTNGGKIWTSYKIGEGRVETITSIQNDIYVVRFMVDSVGYFTSYIDKSIDTGETWLNIFQLKLKGAIIRYIFFSDIKNGIFITQNSEVYKTSNEGESWNLIQNIKNKYKETGSDNEDLFNSQNLFKDKYNKTILKNIYIHQPAHDKDSILFANYRYLTSLNIKTNKINQFEKLPESDHFLYQIHKNQNDLFVVCKNEGKLKLYQRKETGEYKLIKTFKSRKSNFYCDYLYSFKECILIVTSEGEIFGKSFIYISNDNGKTWSIKKMNSSTFPIAFHDNFHDNNFKSWVYEGGWDGLGLFVIE